MWLVRDESQKSGNEQKQEQEQEGTRRVGGSGHDGRWLLLVGA